MILDNKNREINRFTPEEDRQEVPRKRVQPKKNKVSWKRRGYVALATTAIVVAAAGYAFYKVDQHFDRWDYKFELKSPITRQLRSSSQSSTVIPEAKAAPEQPQDEDPSSTPPEATPPATAKTAPAAKNDTVAAVKAGTPYIWVYKSTRWTECRASKGLKYADCYNNPSVIEKNYAEFDKQASIKLTAKQAAILKKIGGCESGFQMRPNESGSSAYGIFQELKVHDARAKRLGGSRYDAATNIAVGIALFLEQGTAPWNSSKSCWGK